MYEASLGGIEERLLERTPDGNLFVNEMTTGGQTIGKMDHLVCFLPGVIALSADAGAVSATSDVGRIPAAQRTAADLATEKARLMQEAHDLVSTCVKFYNMTPTGTRHGDWVINSTAGGMHSLCLGASSTPSCAPARRSLCPFPHCPLFLNVPRPRTCPRDRPLRCPGRSQRGPGSTSQPTASGDCRVVVHHVPPYEGHGVSRLGVR